MSATNQETISASAKRIKVAACKNGCKNPGQDALHGVNQRVLNPTKDGFRCSVCGTAQ